MFAHMIVIARACGAVCSYRSMRAIRAAIGTVDAKITESNALNSALHERMNTLDGGLVQVRKQVMDAMGRVKSVQTCLKDVEGNLDVQKQHAATQDSKLKSLEDHQKNKDHKERDKRRQQQQQEQKEKSGDEITSAATLTATGSLRDRKSVV